MKIWLKLAKFAVRSSKVCNSQLISFDNQAFFCVKKCMCNQGAFGDSTWRQLFKDGKLRPADKSTTTDTCEKNRELLVIKCLSD